MAATQSKIDVLDAAAATISLATVLESGEHRPQHVVVRLGTIGRFFRRHLDTTGDGTGTKAANADYSAGAQDFKLRPAGGTIFIVERLITLVGDNAALVNDGYGAGAALSTGIKIEKYDHGSPAVIDSLHDGILLKTNFDWARLAGNDVAVDYAGTNKHRVWSWQPSSPIRLVGDDSQELRLVLNDDFSGLTEHYFVAEGFKETVQV